MRIRNIYLLATALYIIGCEEPITIQTDQAAPQLVIEAVMTNEMKRHYVKITQTADFYQVGNTPRISDASVTITDNENNAYVFIEEEPGLYMPVQPFAGKVGNTYDLTIMVGSDIYTASEQLLPVTTIDSLTFAEDDGDAEEVFETAYDVFLYTLEPQDQDNYYLFKFYRNGFWLNEDGDDITVTDDVAVGEAIEGIELPYLYFENDTARVEMYSLTREAFVFWNDVASLIFSDGGVFAPLPANPRSNITGGAIGVFQVSAVSRDDIVIQLEEG